MASVIGIVSTSSVSSIEAFPSLRILFSLNGILSPISSAFALFFTPISCSKQNVTQNTAFARSNQLKDKAERADNLFRAMMDAYEKNPKTSRHLKPNVVAVNAVMNACAYTSPNDTAEQNRAMEIAHKLFKVLEDSDYGSPDQITYGTFLKVCANQMPDCTTRQQIMEVLFQSSARDGQVGNLVIQQLRTMGPPELYYRLTGHYIEEDIRKEDLPKEWWCNVVEGRWRKRRHDNNNYNNSM